MNWFQKIIAWIFGIRKKIADLVDHPLREAYKTLGKAEGYLVEEKIADVKREINRVKKQIETIASYLGIEL